jgi:hypothetical protein
MDKIWGVTTLWAPDLHSGKKYWLNYPLQTVYAETAREQTADEHVAYDDVSIANSSDDGAVLIFRCN